MTTWIRVNTSRRVDPRFNGLTRGQRQSYEWAEFFCAELDNAGVIPAGMPLRKFEATPEMWAKFIAKGLVVVIGVGEVAELRERLHDPDRGSPDDCPIEAGDFLLPDFFDEQRVATQRKNRTSAKARYRKRSAIVTSPEPEHSESVSHPEPESFNLANPLAEPDQPETSGLTEGTEGTNQENSPSSDRPTSPLPRTRGLEEGRLTDPSSDDLKAIGTFLRSALPAGRTAGKGAT